MLFTVWSKETKGRVEHKCLITSNGDYIDVATGEKYSKSDGYYHTKLFKVKVVAYDKSNERSGLAPWVRKKCIGCIIIVEEHYDGDVPMYWHEGLETYFSKSEIETTSKLFFENMSDKEKIKLNNSGDLIRKRLESV